MESTTAASAIDRAIADYMEREGVGVGEMAERFGMTANSLRSKRRGVQDWRWSEVLTLAGMTGKSVDALIGWKEGDGAVDDDG